MGTSVVSKRKPAINFILAPFLALQNSPSGFVVPHAVFF